MATNNQRAQSQRLRAFVDAQKRTVQAADKKYDIPDAVAALRELAAPLTRPGDFEPDWKRLYLDALYRDVAGFVLGFVAVRIEICLSDAERRDTFDVFFDRSFVPPARAAAALTSVLAATTASKHSGDKRQGDADDAAVTVSHCLRLLKRAMDSEGLQAIVADLLDQEVSLPSQVAQRRVLSSQTLISHLASLPDLVHNRRGRESPSAFWPRHYFPRLCDAIFAAVFDWSAANYPPGDVQARSTVFRMLSEKLIRVGQVEALVQGWLRAIQASRRLASDSNVVLHAMLLRSVPESCYQQLFLQIMKAPGHDVAKENTRGASRVLCEPKYALLSLLPPAMAASQQFQYVLAHKLLLKAPVHDLFVCRVLVDTLLQAQAQLSVESEALSSPLASVFDVVLDQWSQDDFPASTDYALNVSVTFFLRYAMLKMIESQASTFSGSEWTAKLCKGVQNHMSHSVERVRLLGMRVGETLSLLLSPDNPLNFEIEIDGVDPLDMYGHARVTLGSPAMTQGLPVNGEGGNSSQGGDGVDEATPDVATRKKKPSKCRPVAFALDPDAVVLSDGDDSVSDDQGEEADDDSDAESDSDMSLDAYDLHDDERDLQAKRPMYLKDVIAGLLAEDEREKTEAALEEAERLLRRQPRDLHENAREVVTVLLRLEDKYNTPSFVTLRLNALAAACALSPRKTLPYFVSQALEREQLLQSRIDILQVMERASHELSETGEFRVSGPKTLLRSTTTASGTTDLDASTMASLKTRRFGYRRDPLVAAKRNAFGEHALSFFSPLLFGYVEYRRQLEAGNGLSEVEHIFLAHLLHALATFVEAAGHAPQAVSMAKCLVEFAWVERGNQAATVRRQVLFSVSRVLLVVPPFLLRQELGESIVEVLTWMQQVARSDPDAGCREASRLLLSSSSIPALTLQ